VALAGLAGQTFKDFEVVFVDGRYRKRHRKVMEAVRASGLEQPFFHVPNHRSAPPPWGTTCAGYNTGFMLADGEVIVMLLDHAYAPPCWLAEHARHQAAGPKIIMAPHEYRTPVGTVYADGQPASPGPVLRGAVEALGAEEALRLILEERERFDEISLFSRSFVTEDLASFPREESDVKCLMPTQPWPDPNYFNTKNESFSTSAVLDVNGMDEHYDLGRGPGDPDLGWRLERTGLPLWVVQEAIVHCLNPRDLLPNCNIVIPDGGRLSPPYEHRWYIQDGYAYIAAMKAEGRVRAPNPYDLRKRREEIWCWRELSQDDEPLISEVVVPDEEYFKEAA